MTYLINDVILDQSYFAVGHNASQLFINEIDWERNLFLSLLFQFEICLPDMGAFAHPHLEYHFSRKAKEQGDPWFMTGLKEKYIVPYIRSEFFNEPIRYLKEEIKKEPYTDVSIVPLATIESQHIEFKKEKWPSSYDFGEKFKDRVRTKLSCDNEQFELLSNSERRKLREFWKNEDVIFWRTRLIEDACELTEKQGKKGLRLTEIVRVFYKYLFKEEPKNHNELSIKNLTKWIQYKEKDKYALSVEFFKIICEIYNQNFSEGIRSRNNTNNTGFITYNTIIKPYIKDDDKKLIANVKLPNLEAFQKTSGNTLREIRKQSGEYFEMLNNFRNNPQEEDIHEKLQKALEKYSENIRNQVFKIEEPTNYYPNGSLLEDTMKDIVLEFCIGVPFYITLGYKFYKLMNHKDYYENITIYKP
jgi:hypothetical protein